MYQYIQETYNNEKDIESYQQLNLPNQFESYSRLFFTYNYGDLC